MTRMTKKLFIASAAVILTGGALIGLFGSRFQGSFSGARAGIGDETTLTIKGPATQIATDIAEGDITSYLQGVDDNVTVSYARRTSATYSIFNNSSQQIRLYNSAGSAGQTLTITTKPGYSIKEFTVNWTANNNGACNYTTGTVNSADACSCTIENIGNTSGTGNGQVRISSIVLVYFSY